MWRSYIRRIVSLFTIHIWLGCFQVFTSHGGREKCGISKNVKDILAGRNEDGFTLADMDAIDVGLTPEAHHNDEGVAVEIDLLRHLDDYTMYHEVGTVNKLAGGLC